jgi:hypothetical protein
MSEPAKKSMTEEEFNRILPSQNGDDQFNKPMNDDDDHEDFVPILPRMSEPAL